MSGACSTYGKEERSIQGLGGETWGNLTTWKTLDNIKMDLHEEGCGGMGWIELAQDRDKW